MTIEWFADGKLNASYNCLDRHAAEPWRRCRDSVGGRHARRPQAHHLEGASRGGVQACQCAQKARREEGRFRQRLSAGRPESIAAMLACARIGAVHSVVFSGFSSEALAGRIEDCRSRVLITADEGLRAGKHVPLKKNADAALQACPSSSMCSSCAAPARMFR